MRRMLAVGLLATALAGVLLAGHVRDLERTRVHGLSYVSTYDDPKTTFDKLLARGDGQAFAVIARDPTMSHLSIFRRGDEIVLARRGVVWRRHSSCQRPA